jgi:FixJ family two-component response regulator
MMPNITGMQLHQELVERGSILADRMVFITGSAYLSSAQSYLESVDLPCLDKPFDWAEVRALIKQSPVDRSSIDAVE